MEMSNFSSRYRDHRKKFVGEEAVSHEQRCDVFKILLFKMQIQNEKYLFCIPFEIPFEMYFTFLIFFSKCKMLSD